MQQEWQAFTNWLAGHLPAALTDLNAEASAIDFEYFTQTTGTELPYLIRELYSLHNGQKGMAPGIFIGMMFMPLEQVAHATDLEQGRLPFATDHGGNYVGIQLKTGKIICYSDSNHIEILSKNLLAFLRQQCCSGVAIMPQNQGEMMFGLDTPRTGDW